MHCHQCGFFLPPGAEICPRCSSSTPYNAGTPSSVPPPSPPLASMQSAPGTPSTVDPTQLAPGTPQMVDPTQLAPGTPSMVDPTQLTPGAPPASLAPTQLAPGASPAAFPVPPPSTPNWQAESGQSGAGWVYQPEQPGWPPQPGQSAPGFPMNPPVPGSMPVPPRRTSGASTAVIIVLVVLLILVCSASLLGGGIWYNQQSQAHATSTAMADNAQASATANSDDATATASDATTTALLTPTPYPPYTESNPPSGTTFSGTAQQVVASAQLAGQLNDKYQPTELQSVFQPGQTIYLAYHWNNPGYGGYVYTIWYFDGQQVTTGISNALSVNYQYYDGYISYSLSQDGQGAVEVYLCGKSDCSDRQLAWVRPFTISG